MAVAGNSPRGEGIDGGAGTATCGNVGGEVCSVCGFVCGLVPHAVSIPTINDRNATRQSWKPMQRGRWRNLMGLIVLEALGALLLLVLIVWWTMFSGRKNGELPSAAESEKESEK